MHCPTTLEVNGKKTEFPLPEPGLPLNFENSTGLRYEAEEVRRCILKGNTQLNTNISHELWVSCCSQYPSWATLICPTGLKENINMSLTDSELLTEIMDEARRQMGVVYEQDSQWLPSISAWLDGATQEKIMFEHLCNKSHVCRKLRTINMTLTVECVESFLTKL